MAGASMNDIKSRIKSVNSTMQITKAMELVATSKLRRAKERVEKSRPFYEILEEAINGIANTKELNFSPFFKEIGKGKTLYVVIAGDRGLAGGYNANVFRLTESLINGKDAVFLPIGKKAVEYYRHRRREIFSDTFGYTSEVGVGEAYSIAEMLTDAFLEERFSQIVLVYTKFVSMLSQVPVKKHLLPLTIDSDNTKKVNTDPLFEGESEEILQKIIPHYIGGVIYSAVCEALASESGARRSSMNAANKNASEMIDSLTLKYNRARQAVITQEITEIVSGAQD